MNTRKVGIVVIVAVVVIVAFGSFDAILSQNSSISSTNTVRSTSASTIIDGATLTATCTGCSGSNPNNYIWSGAIDNGGQSTS